MLWNLRTPVLVAAQSARQSSLFFPSHTNSSQFNSNLPRSSLVPGTRAQTTTQKKKGKSTSVAVVSWHFVRCPPRQHASS